MLVSRVTIFHSFFLLEELVVDDSHFLDQLLVYLNLVLQFVFQVLHSVLQTLLVTYQFLFPLHCLALLISQKVHDSIPVVRGTSMVALGHACQVIAECLLLVVLESCLEH